MMMMLVMLVVVVVEVDGDGSDDDGDGDGDESDGGDDMTFILFKYHPSDSSIWYINQRFSIKV